MEQYKQDFIEFMVESDVLTFGDFTTKSGRKTPYFINAGRYRTGAQMRKLAAFYVAAIEAQAPHFDVLFGPAYKGIPLVVATSMVMAERGRDVGFCFNRKEVKDHGEGGVLVGQALDETSRVLFVEDVTTAGTSIRETVPLLQSAAAVTLAGLVVSVDRQERGRGDESALAELSREYAMPCFSIVTVDEIMSHLRGRTLNGSVVLSEERYGAFQAYRARYGA